MRRGRLVVLSGPGGVGKDTVIEALRRMRPQLAYSVSYTTRPRRDYEVEGVHYHFVTPERFQAMLAADDFLEHAWINGHQYGTARAPIEAHLERGEDVILKIDVQGANQLRRRAPAALFIFLAPPDMEELQRRRRLRGSESEAEMEARQRLAQAEMQSARLYDHRVVNDDVQRAASEIWGLIQADRT